MATAVSPTDDFYINADDQHLELFCLIWLDGNVNAKETRDTEQKLRSIINHLERFQDVQQCQQYIEQRSQKDRLVLVVSGGMGREIVPSIHKLRQIISIYVYCMDKKSNEPWACKFRKVKGVIVDLDELISRIQADHRIQKKVEEPLSINFFTTGTGIGKATTGVNGQFVFYQVLIDCLLRLKSTVTDGNELIRCCKKEYKGNSVELSNLHDFKETYSPDKVLWWYTRESFFYKTLNAALRTQNIHMIFLFRKFISDIYHQLQKYQAKKSLQVYRCQMISGAELETLKQCIGQFISVNSFFSTSVDRQKPLSFLDVPDASDDLERILFEIEADPKKITTKPFADVSKISDHPDELEVLFMLGSIFRLQSIHRKDDQIWVIRMTLCSDDDLDLKQVLVHMKQQNGSGDTNLRTLGTILWNMGQPDLAEKYFTRLLKELPPNDPSLSGLYEDLGKLASQRSDFDMSVQWYEKSLALKKQHQPVINLVINGTTKSVGQLLPSASINNNIKMALIGITVAGGNGSGNGLNQLCKPRDIYVDYDDYSIYIADSDNNRIVQWKYEAKTGELVAGGNGKGKRMNQLTNPANVIVDKKNDSLIISDRGNGRLVRWPRRNGTNGETIISNICCTGLAIDNNGDFYASDWGKHEVRRWRIGDTIGTIVAGGNRQGDHISQLDGPDHIFVDQDYSVYVSDHGNHRVVKWLRGAKEGIVVAGGHGWGDRLTQLSSPGGVVVDRWGDLYVADWGKHRIMRWSKGSKEGSIVLGRNGQGKQANQFDNPADLSFDGQGHLYVVDYGNHRVQKFLRDDS